MARQDAGKGPKAGSAGTGGASVAEIRDQAVLDGMLTLRMDGMKKIERGVTTLEEVVKETAE